MLSYISCYFYLLIGTRILGTANAFIYILLLLFTDWRAYTRYGKCFHKYNATFVYLVARVYLVRQMLSYIYCYFCLLIGTHILGTAYAFIYILLLLFTDWYAYTWYGQCFHIYTATVCLLSWRAYTRYGKCFHKYTATFVYLVARVYLVRQMLSYIYCYFCLLIGTHILGTANAFIYILLLLCTDWRTRILAVRQMLSYIYCYFCLLIGTRILGTANAFIYILLLLFTDWCAYT